MSAGRPIKHKEGTNTKSCYFTIPFIKYINSESKQKKLGFSEYIMEYINKTKESNNVKFFDQTLIIQKLEAEILVLKHELSKYKASEDLEEIFKEFSELMLSNFPRVFISEYPLTPQFVEQQYKNFISLEKGRMNITKNEMEQCFQYIQNFKKERLEGDINE